MFHNRTVQQKARPRYTTGFTLIELLVVTAIIVLITGVVLVNNSRFGGVVLLQNLAYDIALSIRQAQVYGISVQRFGSSNFSAGYGVDFDISSPTTYALFADASTQNGLYDCPTPGGVDCELVQASTMSRGYQIQDLCATPSGAQESCGISKVDIVFQRPEPDAWISSNGDSCIQNHASCKESARIVLLSPRGDTMSVVVEANGQIAVQH